MKDLTFEQERVLSLIPYGMENAITQRDISRLTGYSTRNIRAIVNQLRLHNEKLICGTDNGYYIPLNYEEYEVFRRRIKHHLDSLIDTLDAMDYNWSNTYFNGD